MQISLVPLTVAPRTGGGVGVARVKGKRVCRTISNHVICDSYAILGHGAPGGEFSYSRQRARRKPTAHAYATVDRRTQHRL